MKTMQANITFEDSELLNAVMEVQRLSRELESAIRFLGLERRRVAIQVTSVESENAAQ